MGHKDPFDVEIAAWLTDPGVTACKPATRGIWFDLLCHMHGLGGKGELAGSYEDLAKLSRSSPGEVRAAIVDLSSHVVAEIHERDGRVTVVNRRMRREWRARKSNQERQKRFRDNHRCESNGHRNATDNGDVTNSPHENNKNTLRKDHPYAEYFRFKYSEHYGVEYIWQSFDFVQLNNMLKKRNGSVTAEKWQRAVDHYFASELGKHTLAHISVEFASYYLSPQDRFGKPITAGVTQKTRSNVAAVEEAKALRRKVR